MISPKLRFLAALSSVFKIILDPFHWRKLPSIPYYKAHPIPIHKRFSSRLIHIYTYHDMSCCGSNIGPWISICYME